MMDPLLEVVDLDVEEPSELLFRVKVEGADQAPTKVRLVCEGPDLGLMFDGRSAGQDGLIQFNIPVLKDRIKEGTYTSRVEVLIDNRYFAPVRFQVNFKKKVKVVAEAVNVVPRRPAPEITVSAVPVIKPTPKPQAPPAPVSLPVRPARNTPARVNAQTTLKERYRNNRNDEPDEDAILEAARSFVNAQKKK